MLSVTNVQPIDGADETIEVRSGWTSLARCSLWWSTTPLLSGRRVGYVGGYSRSDEQAAERVLTYAQRRLASAGCRTAVGPVDGSIWHRYRFVTERGDRPAFFLEPENPDEYPLDFLSAGFAPLAHYVSAEETDLALRDPRVARAAARLRDAGVSIRPFDRSCYDRELDAIYDVASVSFRDNLLFSPISRHAFHALYEPLRGRIDPDFVRIAEHDGRPIGFSFGIIDFSAQKRDAALDTIVGKTQARLPELRYAGLGAVILDDVRRVAHQRGMRRIVHALMRENESAAFNGSRRVASVFRRYTLFVSELG